MELQTVYTQIPFWSSLIWVCTVSLELLVPVLNISITAPGRVAQSVGPWLVSQRSWARYPVWPHTSVSPSADSRRAVISYWRKYMHEVLVNRLGGLSLPRKRVVRLTGRPGMTLDVYRGRKTTTQQQQQLLLTLFYRLSWHSLKNTATNKQ